MTLSINRGEVAAYLDPYYDTVVTEAMEATPGIIVAHIRNCTSGLCNIPNPHPFVREKAGKYWSMGHNGTVDKNVLIDLIRPEYLEANSPQNGTNQSSWIDSELYFIFILQSLEDFNWQVKPALGYVIYSLRESIPGTSEQLNIFLTNGDTLWAYREGNSLYYRFITDDIVFSTVASQPTLIPNTDWIWMQDGQLVTLYRDNPPMVEVIEDYFNYTDVPEIDELFLPDDFVICQNYPNPFNLSTKIGFALTETSEWKITIYNIKGQVAKLFQGYNNTGHMNISWDATHEASGLYFYKVETESYTDTRKMLLLK